MKIVHRRVLILWLWPAFCGLVVGGLLGAITGSLALFALFGLVAWAIAYGTCRGWVVPASDECLHDPFRPGNIVTDPALHFLECNLYHNSE